MGAAVAQIREFHAELREIRRDLHAHPELGFEEEKSSTWVAEALAECLADGDMRDLGAGHAVHHDETVDVDGLGPAGIADPEGNRIVLVQQ